jgi:hypothetical protein
VSNKVKKETTTVIAVTLTEETAKKLYGLLDTVYWNDDGKDSDLSGIHDQLGEAVDYDGTGYEVDTREGSVKLDTSKFDE